MNPFAESMFVLFAILTLGAWIGQWSWRGISLGTAGVLFAALVFGHFGLSVPKEIMDFGLILFVYAVGLTAGPSFFRTFRRRGMQFVVLALVIVGSGALLTALIAYLLKLSPALAAGLYTGALTCTPALAARAGQPASPLPRHGAARLRWLWHRLSVQHDQHGPADSVFAAPAQASSKDRGAEMACRKSHRNARAGSAHQFRITNPNCEGRTVAEVNPRRLAQVNLSRIKHGERVFRRNARNHFASRRCGDGGRSRRGTGQDDAPARRAHRRAHGCQRRCVEHGCGSDG